MASSLPLPTAIGHTNHAAFWYIRQNAQNIATTKRMLTEDVVEDGRLSR
jgi:hypothetical protein